MIAFGLGEPGVRSRMSASALALLVAVWDIGSVRSKIVSLSASILVLEGDRQW